MLGCLYRFARSLINFLFTNLEITGISATNIKNLEVFVFQVYKCKLSFSVNFLILSTTDNRSETFDLKILSIFIIKYKCWY